MNGSDEIATFGLAENRAACHYAAMVSALWPLLVFIIISTAVMTAVVFFGHQFLPGHGLADSAEKKGKHSPGPLPPVEELTEPSQTLTLKPLLAGVWWVTFEIVLIFMFPWAVAMGNGAVGHRSLWSVGMLTGVLLAGALYIRGRSDFFGDDSLTTD